MKIKDVSSIQKFYEDERKFLKESNYPKPWKQAVISLILGQMETYNGIPELVYKLYWAKLITDEQWDSDEEIILSIDEMLSMEQVFEEMGEKYMYMM